VVLVRLIARTSFGQAALIVVVLFLCRIFVAGGFRRELAWWLSVSGQHLCHEVGATQRHVAGMFVAFRVFQECVKDHADAANKSDPPVYELSFEEERYQKGEGKIEEQGSGRSVLVFFESADRELVCPVVELFCFLPRWWPWKSEPVAIRLVRPDRRRRMQNGLVRRLSCRVGD